MGYRRGMDTVLSHTTALEALRSQNLQSRLAKGDRCASQLPEYPPSREEAQDLVLSGLSAPIHVLMADARRRRSSNLLKTHVAPATLPADSFVYLNDGISCASPELVAVQLAQELSKLELIVLLCELMGIYAICPSEDDGMFTRSAPLTDRKRLGAYLDALGPVAGTAKVRDAMRYACVGSASPRESMLSLRFGLKPAMGGHGLEVLKMNDPVEVRRIEDSLARGVRKPDITFKSRRTPGTSEIKGVAVEHNGKYHNDARQRAIDDRRSNELLAIGFKDYVVNKTTYDNIDYIDGLAATIRKDLGYPAQKLSAKEAAKRRVLRERLYEDLRRIERKQNRKPAYREYEYVPFNEYEDW